MRSIPRTLVCFALIVAALGVAPALSNSGVDRPTPYVTSLSAAAVAYQAALPRSCKETRCSQQADGTYVCIKVNSAPWACKVGQTKRTCTEDPC